MWHNMKWRNQHIEQEVSSYLIVAQYQRLHFAYHVLNGILGSSRSNQNHNVSLDTTAMRNNSITRTPSRREPREAAQKARMKMVESSDSPEQPPPRTRRQTIAVIR